MRAWYKENKALTGLIVLCVLVAAAGTIIITVGITNRPQLTDADKDRAVSHCVKWLGDYTQAPNPVIRCTDAERENPKDFYFRWAPGR